VAEVVTCVNRYTFIFESNGERNAWVIAIKAQIKKLLEREGQIISASFLSGKAKTLRGMSISRSHKRKNSF
jgi:hypothetical protein